MAKSEFYLALPSNAAQRAERDIAGCLLVNPFETVRKIRKIVSPSDFSTELGNGIYAAVLSLIDEESSVDPTLILARAEKLGVNIPSEEAAELMQHYASTADETMTAEFIRDCSIRRAAQRVGMQLVEQDISVLEGLAKLQELSMGQQSELPTPAQDADTFLDYLNDIESGKTAPFIKTGFKSLDNILSGGLVTSGLITIAARPGTGKTTVALNLAESIAASGNPVLYFSLEMDRKQLWARRIGSTAGLSYSSVYSGDIRNDAQMKKLINAADLLARSPLYIVDKPCTIEDIERVIRTMDGVKVAVIDHIGLLKGAGSRSRYEFVTDITHRLKQIALSTGVPIVSLCQLNRASEARESKRPSLADLRDSGAIEEDSDVVALLFRPAVYFDEENKPKPWEEQDLDIIVDKNRHGMTGTATLGFVGSIARIRDRA